MSESSENRPQTGSKLSEEQILEFLKSLNVPVRINDIKVPSCEFMVRVFECFLKDLQIDITSHKLRPWEAVSHIENAEIYEDAQLLILLAMSVNHVISPSGLNITVQDIVEPKPKRTKKILNYLIVFWNYYLQKYARFRVLEEAYENDAKKAQDLILENQSLDEKYSDMLKVLSGMQSKEELASTAAEKEAKAVALQAECDVLTADYQTLKGKEANIRNQIGAVDVQIITAKQRLEELGQLILSSPDRINSEIKKLQDRVRVEDTKLKEWENKYKDMMKLLELERLSLEEKEQQLNALKEIDEAIEILRTTGKGTIDTYENVNTKEAKLKRLQVELSRKEDENQQLQHKNAKLTLSNKKQFETLKDVLKTYQRDELKAKNELEFVKTAVNSAKQDLDSECDEIVSLTEKCKQALEKTKEREAEFNTNLRNISDQFRDDVEEIIAAMHASFHI